ncbi:hypothetical protein FH972_024864 [Carpinus fangiana]|uniref:Association with the SNF1 complex (ASC) domain-containing protein n=1 Tax=Carpinus fangiana TaxID=176857 RepID=A0A5N6KZQ9_9ROSI|nr:hypothetical protein FH972_024864 [Carpinus fangiana]
MGNSASKEDAPPQGGSSHVGAQDPKSSIKDDQQRKPRRRDSIQVLPSTRASAVPPSASLDTAQGQSSLATGNRVSHTRGRSQTSATPASRPILDSDGQVQSPDTQGSQGSLPSHTTDPDRHTPPQPIPTRTRSPYGAGPTAADPEINDTGDDLADPSIDESSYNPYQESRFKRPPRLPLPIQEEVLSPGSPIISPADITGEVPIGDDAFPRNPSMLSSTTVDEDEQGELGEEFRDPKHKDAPLVETTIRWPGGGKDVYITGSFSRWNKKWRMHRIAEGSDIFTRTLGLPPGVHHLTFVVDGDMKRSDELPTAVDYTNYLVNYIDVHLDPIAEDASQHDTSHHVTPQPTPTIEKPALAIDTPQQPPTPEIRPQEPSQAPSTSASGISPGTSTKPHVARRQEDRAYHSEIPRFLADLDEPEESSRFHRASAVLGTQPAPPSLPMFLNKSILNGATPMKDDASVLIMPNHTVLNHLATSSIKNNVLATSGTTRYKRKYVTTIMYKPTNDNGT